MSTPGARWCYLGVTAPAPIRRAVTCMTGKRPHPAEVQISGDAGSMMLFDSRLWHCVTTNHSDQPRLALNVGYAPWWLNLQPVKEGTADFQQMVVETNGKPNVSPPIPGEVYDNLPSKVKPLVRHMVA